METEYKEFKIIYDEDNERFTVVIDGRRYNRKSLKGLKSMIDGIEKKGFDRISVIFEQFGEWKKATITSIAKPSNWSYEPECWISIETGRIKQRQKVSAKILFLDNEANKSIIKEIKEKQILISVIKGDIHDLKLKLQRYELEKANV